MWEDPQLVFEFAVPTSAGKNGAQEQALETFMRDIQKMASVDPSKTARKSGLKKTWPVEGVVQGDCVAAMQAMPEGSVDLVFADPPFNIGYEYDQYDDQKSADEYLQWSLQWMQQVHRVLKPTGSFWLAIGDDFAAELKVLAHRSIGFFPRSWVIWYYTFGVNCKRKFTRSHTHLLYFTKDASQFTFNQDDPAIRIPSARQLVYGDRRANPKGRLPDDTWILRPQDLADGFGEGEDSWYFPRVAGTFKQRAGFHGCQMPEQLLARIIRSCSQEGDIVLDPFAGSGSTLLVARKLGRSAVGFEQSASYVKEIRKRWKATKVGDALEGAEDPLSSAPSTADGRRLKTEANGESAGAKSVKDKKQRGKVGSVTEKKAAGKKRKDQAKTGARKGRVKSEKSKKKR